MTANQRVAWNLMRIRKARNLSQAQASEFTRWAPKSYAQVEASWHGSRIRHFTANDIDLLARAFGVSVGYFFQEPYEGAVRIF